MLLGSNLQAQVEEQRTWNCRVPKWSSAVVTTGQLLSRATNTQVWIFLAAHIPPRYRLHFSSWIQGSVWRPAQTRPHHGSTAEMGSTVDFCALLHGHCDKLPRVLSLPSAFLLRKAKCGAQWAEPQPQPQLRCPCPSVTGAAPAAGQGEEGPVAAVLGEAGLSSEEEGLPEALETLAPGSHGTLPA